MDRKSKKCIRKKLRVKVHKHEVIKIFKDLKNEKGHWNEVYDKLYSLPVGVLEGSCRIVIPLNKDRVIKVAFSETGLAQNKCEIDVYKNCDKVYRQCLNRIYTYHPNNYWLIQDRVKIFDRPTSKKIAKLNFAIDYFVTTFNLKRVDLKSQIGKSNSKNRLVLFDYGLNEEIWNKYY